MTRGAFRSKSNSLVREIRGKLQQIFWVPNDPLAKISQNLQVQLTSEQFSHKLICNTSRMSYLLCSDQSSRKSRIWSKLAATDKIFGKVPSAEIQLNFLGPAGGSRTRKGAFALSQFHWNSLEGEIRGKLQQIFLGPNDPLGKDFSKSVSSIDLGAIFP